MNIKERIGKVLKRKSPEKLAEGVAISFEERKQKGEKDPIDNTLAEAKRIIKENPDLEVAIAREILKELIENEKMPERLFAKTAKYIAQTPEIPDTVITQAVQETERQVSGEVIEEIIVEGEVNPKERLRLIKNVEDKEIISRRVKDELKIVYDNCKNEQDWEISSLVKEIVGLLEEEDLTVEIKDLIHQIVGRKMAENYYDDKRRGTRIYELSKIMPYEEMMEENLPEIVQREYRLLEDKEGKKEDRFTKTNLTHLILDKMADDISKRYKETGIFAIPQSNNMKNLTVEEEKHFIKTIQNLSEEQITEEEIRDIRAQIRGRVTNKQTKEDMLINSIKKLPSENKSESIDLLIKLMGDSKTLETIDMLESTGVLKRLEAIPEEKRKQSIESIGEVLEKRKLITQTVKFGESNEQKIDIYIKSEEDGR